MNNLSKRERTLIYVLVCFLIVTIGLYFFIFPVMDKYLVIKDAFSQKQMMAAEMRSYIEGIPTTEDIIKKTNEDLNSLAEPYFGLKDNELLDRFLTEMVEDHGLTPVSLTVTTPAYEVLTPYKKVLLAPKNNSTEKKSTTSPTEDAEMSLKNESLTAEQIAAAEEEKAAEIPTGTTDKDAKKEQGKVLLSSITVEVTDKGLKNFYTLIDDVSKNPQLCVKGFEVKLEDEKGKKGEKNLGVALPPALAATAVPQAAAAGNDNTAITSAAVAAKTDNKNYNFTIDFEVFMYDKQA
ncbi:MAG: hypothetical protein RR639_05520 [Hydrogenoanaerobacterium sp.]